MKRCPQCSRVETDDALVYCRVDGAALNSDSASAFNETETRIAAHDRCEYRSFYGPDNCAPGNTATDRQAPVEIEIIHNP